LGTLVASAPCVGDATGLPMEGEGKDAGRQHLMLVVVCFVLLCFVLNRTFG
jgi:hypothetical protein